MPATFSVNIGTEYEASRLPDIISVLKNIPDNTDKQISPKDVRDAFLSTWANSPFKQTLNQNGTEYIGIDSGNPSNRDIKQKILLGKRSFGNSDILTPSLLSSLDNDIYIFNTKPDSWTQSNTRMVILSGTDSSLYTQAPYIESKTDGSNYEFNFRNPSLSNGSINISSSTGRVAINGIIFPTVADSSASASNGQVLRYKGTFPYGSLKWDNTNVSVAEIGTPGTPTNLYGSPVNVNGYSLEFVNPTSVPVPVGGIPAGMTFGSDSFYNGSSYQNWPLSEVLRMLLYPKLPPSVTFDAINSISSTNFAEIGTTASINLNYQISVFPRTDDEYIRDFCISSYEPVDGLITVGTVSYKNPPYSGLSFSGIPGTTFSGSIPLNKHRNTYGTVSFYFNTTDLPGYTASSYPFGFSYSQKSDFGFVYPVFYGFTSSIIDNTNANFTNGAGSISKLLTTYPGASNSISINSVGSGYFYFAYPTAYFPTSITKIYDPNGFILFSGDVSSSGFTYSNRIKTNYDIPANYTIWRTTGTCSYSQNGQFEFKF